MGEITNFEEMENTEPKEDLIAKYSGKPFAPLVPPTAQNEPVEKAEYQALIEHNNRRSARFRIVDLRGVTYGSGYGFLMGWLFTPPSLLTLYTSSHIFTFEGRGLEAIERALMDEKVKELRVYNPDTHTLLDDTKTVLTSLEVK